MIKHPWNENFWLPGVLSRKQIYNLQEDGYIFDFDIPTFETDKDKEESSVDLHVTDECYKMLNGSLKPHKGTAYKKILNNEKIAERYTGNNDIFKLEKKSCYVFKLQERLTSKLQNIYGQATSKSTIGRLDVITRLIVDGENQYESFDYLNLNNSNGELYLEIIPNSFNIEVKKGDKLSQLRFFYGNIEDSIISDNDFIKSILIGSNDGQGYLSVNTTNLVKSKEHKAAAYKSKKNIDNSVILIDTKSESEKYDPNEYWDIIKSDDNNFLILEAEEFYIIRSKERIALPPGVAVYCKAIDESLGEMRIHYAGFVHPYFGRLRNDGEIGTPLIFEVRAHNSKVTLTDGERLAKLIFYRMSEDVKLNSEEEVNKKNEAYGNQELELSKYFKKFVP